MSGPLTEVTESFDGYAVPPGRYIANRERGPKYLWTLGLWVLILTAGMMVLALVDSRGGRRPEPVHLPAGLRSAPDRAPGGDQSPVHLAGR